MMPQRYWRGVEGLIREGLQAAVRSGDSSGSAVFWRLHHTQKLTSQATEESVKEVVAAAEREFEAAKQRGAPALPLPALITYKLSELGLLKADQP